MEKIDGYTTIAEFASFAKHTGSATKKMLEILLNEFDSHLEELGREKEKVRGGEFIAFVEAATAQAIHEICDVSKYTTQEVLMHMVDKEKKLTRLMNAFYE